MHIRLRFLFPWVKRWKITFFMVEVVEWCFWTVAPGQQRGVGSVFSHAFVSGSHVEVVQSLSPGVEEDDGGMEAVHTGIVAEKYGKCRHPAGLPVHADIRLQHILFLRRMQYLPKRVQSKIGIPG